MSVSGSGLNAKVGANTIGGVYSAAFRETVGKLGRTTGADAGFTNVDAGCKTGTLTLRLYYDLTATAYTDVGAGTVCTSIAVYATVGAGVKWVDMPLSLVTDSEITGEVEGRLEATVTLENKGVYTVTDV